MIPEQGRDAASQQPAAEQTKLTRNYVAPIHPAPENRRTAFDRRAIGIVIILIVVAATIGIASRFLDHKPPFTASPDLVIGPLRATRLSGYPMRSDPTSGKSVYTGG